MCVLKCVSVRMKMCKYKTHNKTMHVCESRTYVRESERMNFGLYGSSYYKCVNVNKLVASNTRSREYKRVTDFYPGKQFTSCKTSRVRFVYPYSEKYRIASFL